MQSFDLFFHSVVKMTTNSKKHKGNPPKSASTDKEGQLKLYSPDYAVKVNTSYQQKSDDQNKNMVSLLKI